MTSGIVRCCADGTCSYMLPVNDFKTVEEIICEHFTYRPIPIAFNFPAGHIDDNRALTLGSNCKLEVSANGTLLTYF